MEKNTQNPLPATMRQGKPSQGKTVFTIIVYFSKKKNGEYYTQYERDSYDNRFFFPSYDYVVGEGGVCIDTHNEAYNKCLKAIERRKGDIITALLHYNAPDGRVFRVCKYTQAGWAFYATPVYKIGMQIKSVVIAQWKWLTKNAKPYEIIFNPNNNG